MKSFKNFAFLSIPLALTVAASGCSDSKQIATPSFLLTPLPSAATSAPVATAAPTTAPTAAPSTAATTAPTTAPTNGASSAPTASPSAAASVAPSSAIVANPTSLDFPNDPSQGTACAGYNAAQSFSVTESAYTGTFTATIDKSVDASVTAGPATQFVVTPTSSVKTVGEKATVTVIDTMGGSTTVAVTFSGTHFCLP